MTSSLNTCTLTVPATTANLGPGFDCLGAALALYNEFCFTRIESGLEIIPNGTEADRVSRDETNLAYRAYCQVFAQVGETPYPVRLEINLGVPLARGLGSSATAIAAGIAGANYLLGGALSPAQILALGVTIEGHPDNIVPALLGGCRLAADRDGVWSQCEVPWHSSIQPVIAVPNFELSTEEARRVLPESYSRADAIFNTAHLGLLLRGINEGRGDWLQTAMQDRIHQPYRKALIPGFEAVRSAAIAAGAYELVISGAGPTLLALAHRDQAAAVGEAMQTAWTAAGVGAVAGPVDLDVQGTRLQV
ncbi:MAG: homoserine kinase [Oscillatoriales cyanobacterium]|nr:MAG: homoserine kinase [Oscillatoriales cyanobacterium]